MRAAQLRGEQTIPVQFLTGDDDTPFLLAVEGNVAHGLPLSLSERKAAAVPLIAAASEDRAMGAEQAPQANSSGTLTWLQPEPHTT